MFVFDVALGKVNYYGELPGTDDSLILVPFEVSSDIDDDIRDNSTLDDLISYFGSEAPAGRITATAAGVTSGAIAWLSNDGWVAPTSGSQITRIVVCYQPESTSTDADIIPLVSVDTDWTPDGVNDFSINMDDGYFQASGYQYV